MFSQFYLRFKDISIKKGEKKLEDQVQIHWKEADKLGNKEIQMCSAIVINFFTNNSMILM